MKMRLFLILVAFVSMTGVAFGDEVDAKFKQVRKYLKDQNLDITNTTKSLSKVFTQEAIVVTGKGVSLKEATSKGQKKATAITAAKVVAQRRLAEVLNGVAIVSETTIKDSVLESDLIKTAVSAFLEGAEVVSEEYNEADELAVVVMRVGTKGPGSVGAALYETIIAEPKIKENLDKPVIYVPPADVPPPAAPPQPYDGLIIDARSQNFRPALINRIFTHKGDVLYDPAKISQKVLVEQGCGEYTNSEDKAKAALGKRGVKNPLVIKASGTVSPSDLQVDDKAAAKIFAANQASGFIADARVAFVLK